MTGQQCCIEERSWPHTTLNALSLHLHINITSATDTLHFRSMVQFAAGRTKHLQKYMDSRQSEGALI
jgi:hypothetical protein